MREVGQGIEMLCGCDVNFTQTTKTASFLIMHHLCLYRLYSYIYLDHSPHGGYLDCSRFSLLPFGILFETISLIGSSSNKNCLCKGQWIIQSDQCIVSGCFYLKCDFKCSEHNKQSNVRYKYLQKSVKLLAKTM